MPVQSVWCSLGKLTRHGYLVLLQRSRGASSTELHYSYERTRTTVTAGLCKKLKDLMADFQAIRQKLTDDHRWAFPFTQASYSSAKPTGNVIGLSCCALKQPISEHATLH